MPRHNNIDNDSLAKWKESFAKSGIVYETDNEYYEAIHNLTSFFDILIEIDIASKKSKSNSDDHDGKNYLIDKDGNHIIL